MAEDGRCLPISHAHCDERLGGARRESPARGECCRRSRRDEYDGASGERPKNRKRPEGRARPSQPPGHGGDGCDDHEAAVRGAPALHDRYFFRPPAAVTGGLRYSI